MAIKDIFAEGVEAGWQVHNASLMEADTTMETDIVIVGTGAGGGTSAEVLANAGFNVLMVEEGPLKSSNDFNMDEREAYSTLYQEALGRATKDGAMSILQGRCVGGSTTINWTSSFRTPDNTLNYWQSEFDTRGVSPEEMAPWFADREARLKVAKWPFPPNNNNSVLRDGCTALGYKWDTIPRNVSGCWDLGYCGMGCPTNAKQSMLVTTVPGALKKNAGLVFLARANHLLWEGDKVTGLVCYAMDQACVHRTGKTITIKAKHFILSGGAINTPAILMKSSVPDPYRRVGKRTFLHPTPMSMAVMPELVEGYYGAPQSIHSDHFQWINGVSGPMGYKLETTPIHPKVGASLLRGKAEELARDMANLPNTNICLALLRDGFHEQSQGGEVQIRNDGTPVLDYQLNDYIWDGVRRSLVDMAEIQFAAGARTVRPSHYGAPHFSSFKEARSALQSLPLAPYQTFVGSAHVMGGCAMGENKRLTVVNSSGEHHYLENLSVIDGSVFPTSIGANPQLSIYGQAVKMSTNLAKKLNAPVIARSA